MSTVPTYEHPAFGTYVYICPVCGQPGERGASCNSALHDPPETIPMAPSTAVALAYSTYRRTSPDTTGVKPVDAALVEKWETAAVEPTPTEMVLIADICHQPLHFLFTDHAAQ